MVGAERINLPYKDKEKRNEYMRERRARARREQHPEEEIIRGKQDRENELLEHKEEYEENIGYNEAYNPIHHNRIEDLINPTDRGKGQRETSGSDDPAKYRGLDRGGGENKEGSIAICNFCGCPLDKRGKCPNCNPPKENQDVEYQRALSQSNQEMNREQFEQQNEPKPPKAGENPDVDSWLKTH